MNELEFIESIKVMPLLPLPVKTTIVRLSSGIVMLSPGSMLKESDLARFPEVTDLVAPSLLHWAGVPQASRVIPKARTWGENPKFNWSNPLTLANWKYQEELPAIAIAGMPKVNEFVFIHKKSRTLIACDLAFNLVHARGLGAWIILNMFGTYRRFGVSKFFLKMVKDRPAFERSIENLFKHEFENIIVGHGDGVFGNGKEKLRIALNERGIFPK